MFFLSKADTVRERLVAWWNFSIFNRIDLLIILLSILSFGLRLSGSCLLPPYSVICFLMPSLLPAGEFTATKTVYCINCIMFFVRSLSFYTASSYLGPKLVMIAKMVRKDQVTVTNTLNALQCVFLR